MLKKLIRYEFQAVSRILIPVYLLFAVIVAITTLSLSLPLNHGILTFIPTVTAILFVISIIALIAITLITMIVRFFKDFATNEGYLMFTLPAKTSELIISKWITSFLCITASILLCIGAIVLIAKTNYYLLGFDGFQEAWTEFLYTIGGSTACGIIILIGFYLTGLSGNILVYMTSIALGHSLAKNKLLGAFFGYLILYGSGQLLGLILILILYFTDAISNLSTIMFVVVIMSAVIDYILYLITHYFLKNKLNLE